MSQCAYVDILRDIPIVIHGRIFFLPPKGHLCGVAIVTMKLIDEWYEYGYIIPICFFGAINTAINIIKIKEKEKKDD